MTVVRVDGSAASAPVAPPVFISYSSRDATTAEQVCAHLEAAGIRCWIAPRNIPTGIEYADGIVRGIDGARVMVLVFSPASNESIPVRREVELASHRGIPVLPIMIERTVPTGGMEYYLRSRQWRAAFAGPLADSLRVLELEIRAHLTADPKFDPARRVLRRLLHQLGGATAAFVLFLAAATVLLWVIRASLGSDERRLGIAALLVVAVSWPVVRWQGLFATARSVLAIKGALLLLLIGGWTAAAVLAHRVPGFSGPGAGILVARIAGDGDRQAWLASKLHGYVEAGRGIDEDVIEVKLLPRRVASPLEAQRYARATGAMVVLWGSATAGNLQVYLTMADGEGVYDAAAPILANSDLALSNAAAHVEDVLVTFLSAQRLYQKKDFKAAVDRLDLIPEALGVATEARDQGLAANGILRLTPVEATLSTVYFYRATARYQDALQRGEPGEMPQVIADYEASIRYATIAGSRSGFVTPVANLAGIRLSRGQPADLKEAGALLERTACDTQSAFAPVPCLYVEYHRAVLHNIHDRYAEARATFDHLLNVSWPAAALPEGSPHRLLVGYAYRNRAYSSAKLGDANPAANRQDYERADRDWLEAERVFGSLGIPLPPASYLTRARIQIGLRHANEARAALETVLAGGRADPGVPLVEATIAACAGDDVSRDKALASYLMSGSLRLGSQSKEFAELKRYADRQLAAFDGLCRSSREER